ncbi:unnamed protein product [Rhizophagus irregularis]|nr:unnamed protein product [Rhizophagus irregularis]
MSGNILEMVLSKNSAFVMRSGTNLEEVTKLFTLMHEKKLTPNKTTKTILKNIFRHHLNNDAISWIRESPSFFRGFEDMKARNLKPDIYSYVPLIHQLAQHERADEALKLIEVKEQKVHLNTVAYNVFIKVYNMASKYEQTGQIIGYEHYVHLVVNSSMHTPKRVMPIWLFKL